MTNWPQGEPNEQPDSPQYGSSGSPYGAPQYGSSGPQYGGSSGPYPPPYGAQQYPAGPGYVSPAYGYGGAYDPVTGQPLSDKSKVTAGLLQLLLGFFLALGGVGRLYAGNTTLGVVQIVLSVVGWAAFWCGFVLVVPFLVFGGLWIWFIIDGIIMLAGRPVDGQGRLLRS